MSPAFATMVPTASVNGMTNNNTNIAIIEATARAREFHNRT